MRAFLEPGTTWEDPATDEKMEEFELGEDLLDLVSGSACSYIDSDG